jgi:L-threonylcarbamoyladenylate synthase
VGFHRSALGARRSALGFQRSALGVREVSLGIRRWTCIARRCGGPMKRLLVDPRDPDAAAIESAAEALRQGGVVAYPTDTLYALAVDPRSDAAVTRLYALKGRDTGVAIALIAADAAQAQLAGPFGPSEMKLAEAFWPGPLTILVPAAAGMSRLLSGGTGTIGVRVPAHEVARRLAAAFGSCITATSANISGEPAFTTAGDVAKVFDRRIDVLLDGGPAPGGPPSTIVQLVDGRPALLRAGAVAWDRVLESLQ